MGGMTQQYSCVNQLHFLLYYLLQRVPVKLKRRFEQFEALMDPSRNHRVLRAYQRKLQPPVIPFMPLVVKGTGQT